jgi:hypothetical protein
MFGLYSGFARLVELVFKVIVELGDLVCSVGMSKTIPKVSLLSLHHDMDKNCHALVHDEVI